MEHGTAKFLGYIGALVGFLGILMLLYTFSGYFSIYFEPNIPLVAGHLILTVIGILAAKFLDKNPRLSGIIFIIIAIGGFMIFLGAYISVILFLVAGIGILTKK